MKNKTHMPPRWAERFFESFCDPALCDDLLGDLHERFVHRTGSMSVFRAQLLYFWDVLTFLRPYIVRKDRKISLLFALPTSFQNSRRSLAKDPLHSFLTVFGLSLSIVAFLMIVIYVDDELKYDRHYDKGDRIYRVTTEINSTTASTPVALSDASLGLRLKDHCPEVEETVAMAKVRGRVLVSSGSRSHFEDMIYKAERTYFRIFSHHWIAGNPELALSNPGSIVLTSTMAKKYFGKDPPLNNILTIANREYAVTGVIEDLPSQTDLKFDALVSTDYEHLSETDFWSLTFLLSRNSLDRDAFQMKLSELSEQYLQHEVSGTDAKITYRSENLLDVHFGDTKLFDTPKSSRLNIYIFSTIAFFILFIACSNYINLAVARAIRKTSEAGIRKILGARSSQLVIHNLCESFMIFSVSLLIAGLSAWILLPYFAAVTEKNIEIQNILNPRVLLSVLSLSAVSWVLSGLYPGFAWSAVASKMIVNGRASAVGRPTLQNSLIAFQFTISIGLTICTNVVYDQWKLLSETSPGFDYEQVIVAEWPNVESVSLTEVKDHVSQLPFVEAISSVGYNSLPTSSMDIDSYEVDIDGQNVSRIFNNITVDENFLDLLRMKLVQGRNFSSPDIEDDEHYVLVNESFVRTMGWAHPLHQTLFSNSKGYQVIGVVSDFHFNSLHKLIEPIVIHGGMKSPEKLMIKVSNADAESITLLEQAWKKASGTPLNFKFLDSFFAEQYRNERTMQRVLVCFAFMAILTASLGLAGLAALAGISKEREVAIRKILGAGFIHIAASACKDLCRIVLVSICIAIPMSSFLLNHWLKQFPYQTKPGVADFTLPLIFSVAIAFLAVGFFVVKSASANPLTTLKKGRA